MFDPYHKWLGIAKDQRPPTHYQLLAIPPGESDPEVIDEAAVRQSAHVRTYQIGPHAADCTRLLNEIAQAKLVLLNPAKRQAYDQQLAQARAEQVTTEAPAAMATDSRAEFRVADDEPMIARTQASSVRSRSIAQPARSNAALLWGVIGASVLGLVVVIVVVAVAFTGTDTKRDVVQKKLRPELDKLIAKEAKEATAVKKTMPAHTGNSETPAADKAPTVPAVAPVAKGLATALVANPLPQPPPPVDVPGKTTIDLIPLIDPVRDAVHGKWAIAGGVLHCNDRHLVPRVEIPYQPPEEYDFTVVFSQPELRNGISLVMPNPNGGSFFWHLGSVQGSRFGFFTKLDQRGAIDNLITPNQAHTTTVQVRRDHAKGLVNGKVLVDRRTDYRDLTCDRWRKIRDTSVLALACDDPTVFHYVRLVEITGTGTKVR